MRATFSSSPPSATATAASNTAPRPRLLCSRNDLPYAGMTGLPESYRTFLGLCSHEYFHTWNVKRIKPAAFTPYDLDRENYTTLLWAFEGFTSYYDDLALLRSGVIELKDWLELTAKTISNVQRGPAACGRRSPNRASTPGASSTARTRTRPNAVVSYYAKGALVRAGARPDAAQPDRRPRFARRRHARALGALRQDRHRRRRVAAATAKVPSLGVKTGNDANEARLANVFDGGPAQAAGLSAGDIVLAIDGLRVTSTTLDKLLARHQPGDSVRIHAFRRDELMEFTVRLDPPSEDTVRLTIGEGANALRKQWLGD
jgi:predicted metalloprotease with PDZ domain